VADPVLLLDRLIASLWRLRLCASCAEKYEQDEKVCATHRDE
jgi:hypothetical protein